MRVFPGKILIIIILLLLRANLLVNGPGRGRTCNPSDLNVEMRDRTERSYDPRRQQGRLRLPQRGASFLHWRPGAAHRASPDLKLANRELGTVEGIGQDGRISLKMNGGREVELDSVKNPHLDHGYAVTSHSSQGQTADRVLIHVNHE
jgi:ATP-dependent exoDNAse (exonuclease V) alpha subunit